MMNRTQRSEALATEDASRPATTTVRTARTLARDLAPICAMVFAEFLAMGLPLPVLPVHVHGALGFGSLAVGLVIGAQSWMTLLTRHGAGTRTDRNGPSGVATRGLLVSTMAGVLYALSYAVATPGLALAVLLLGRVLLGLGESLVITSALSWGVALAGRERSGVVMSWIGIAMYGAIAVGAPLGTALTARAGFVGMSAVAALAPIAGLVAARFARPVAAASGERIPFYRVVSLIWLPGLGLALAALGFGALAAFSSLLFAERGWPGAPLAMSAFGAAYTLARIFFGTLPDRFGGARVAAASAAIAGVGQLGMWLAPTGAVAVLSAALTGLGFSLAFPSFGVEAVRRVPPQNRGVALGAYTACFDLTMGVGVPALGLVVGAFGYGAAFAVGAAAATGSLIIALAVAARSGRPS